MARQLMMWTAPTCACQILLEYDDTDVPLVHRLREKVTWPDGRMFESKPCSVHSKSIWKDTTWVSEVAPMVEENTRISKATKEILATKANAVITKRFYDGSRVLHMVVPDMSLAEVASAQTACNTSVGAAKVKVEKVASGMIGP